MSGIKLVEDLLTHCMERNNANIRRMLDLVDEPQVVVALAMGVALQTLRSCVHGVANLTPNLARHPEAIQMAIVASMLARMIDKDDYDRLLDLPQVEINSLVSEIMVSLNTVKEMKL